MSESPKAKTAFDDYYALGPGRSLAKLVAIYQTQTKTLPPTKLLQTLKDWSMRHGWQKKVAERDQALSNEQLDAMKKAARESGYAVMENRLGLLQELTELLWSEVNDEDKRWLPDVKAVGTDRVDIVRFNGPLIQQLRETLNDMALEMGGRVKNVELAGKGGGPIQVQDMEATRAKRWAAAAPAMTEALADDRAADQATEKQPGG